VEEATNDGYVHVHTEKHGPWRRPGFGNDISTVSGVIVEGELSYMEETVN
jgi:hypothetical protein